MFDHNQKGTGPGAGDKDPVDWDAALANLTTDTDTSTGTATIDPDAEPAQRVDSAGAQTESGPTRAEARPILPDWARSKQSMLTEAKRVVDLGLHTCAYHAVRVPKYGAKLAVRAPVGVYRLGGHVNRWLWDSEGRAVRAAAVARQDYEAYRKLASMRDRHVRWRGLVVAAGLTGSVIGAGVLYVIGGPILWAALAAATIGFGIAGAPADKPLLDTAVVKTSLSPLTSDVVIRGLSVLGIGGLNQAVSKQGDKAIGFVTPIARDGQGWRAEVDLPYGVTVGDVVDKRDRLASGLGRPLGCVWPEGRPEVHPGRLVLWVGDEDMAAAKQPAWPMLSKGTVNLFESFPLGTDPRGRTVAMTLMFASMVVGAIPRMGKTFAVRLILLAAALDPRAELRVFNLKGGSDFAPLEPVCHAYRSGDDPDDIEYVVGSLRQAHEDMRRRYRVIRDLPRDVCPESKVTDELASKKSLGLHPVVIALDECQRGYENTEHGDEITEICEDLVRRGPAVGIMLISATQRPDSKSLPRGISANAALRLCMKVQGQVENDMVLGTSAYKNGIRATMFGRRDQGIGYLAGEADEAQIVRTHFIDGVAAETITARARSLREQAGTITGHAAGEAITVAEKPRFDLLKDLLSVFTSRKKEWNSTLVDRLVELRPDHYGHRWAELNDKEKTNALTAELKNVKAEHIVGQVGHRDDAGKTVNRRGVDRDQLREIITLRDGNSGSN